MGVVKAFVTVSREGAIVGPGQVADGAASRGFEVDRNRVPAIIADLRRAVASLAEAEAEARKADAVLPPGDDPVSAEAARATGSRLVGEHLAGSARNIERLESVISALSEAAQQYDAEEDETSPFVRQVSTRERQDRFRR